MARVTFRLDYSTLQEFEEYVDESEEFNCLSDFLRTASKEYINS